MNRIHIPHKARKLVTLLAMVSALLIADNAPATPPVTVNVYSGFVSDGGGAPYSDLAGSFQSLIINFGTATGWNWHPFSLGGFGADMTGFLYVRSDNTYTFTWNSDDGAFLFIDNVQVGDRGGLHWPEESPVSLSVQLTKGTHSFEVQFYEGYGGPSGFDLNLPLGVTYGFAGTPGNKRCEGKSRSALNSQFGSPRVAASALGFSDTKALRVSISEFCKG